MMVRQTRDKHVDCKKLTLAQGIIFLNKTWHPRLGGLSGGSVVKNLPANVDVGDMGLIPGLGRSPGGGNGNPHQYSCLENPTD